MTAEPAHPLSFFHPASLVATVFGAGLSPVAPGTVGSLVALPAAWLIHVTAGPLALLVATAAVFLVGWWASSVYVGKTGFEDPGAVVVDEVAGQWLVLAVAPLDIWYFAAAFVLFRLFDIAKPWPVSWADGRIKGGFGVMFDDILAGLYGAAVLLVVLWLVEGSHVL
ncbi:MAG: phosphatidylglycerophosphatase A [Rhodospirillales bacterium]